MPLSPPNPNTFFHRLRGAVPRAVPILLATVGGAALIALSGRAQQSSPPSRFLRS